MVTINLLPHHVAPIFYNVVYDLSIEDTLGSAYNGPMRENTRSILHLAKDQNQQVRIVSTFDSICASCPFKPSGEKARIFICPPRINKGLKLGETDEFWARTLNLADIIDGDPITCRELRVRITEYDRSESLRLFAEPGLAFGASS